MVSHILHVSCKTTESLSYLAVNELFVGVSRAKFHMADLNQ